MLANPFGPTVAVVLFEPSAVGFVQVEGTAPEWVVGFSGHSNSR